MLEPDTLYQHHLRSQKVLVFTYPYGVHLLNDQAVVFDFSVKNKQDDTHCRCYYFMKHWMSVLVTFDESLQLKPDSEFHFPFAFNCDITTPHYCSGRSLYTTDILLDIIVKPDGASYMIEDETQFYEAYENGMFGTNWYEGASKALEWWCTLLEKGAFIDYLNSVAPFPTKMSVNHEPLLIENDIDEIPFLNHPLHPRFG